MKMLIDNLTYRTYQIFSYLIFLIRWSFRLGKVGIKSYWISPLRIINPSLIKLGRNTIILNSARIEIHRLNDSSEGIVIKDGVNIGHNFFCSCAKYIEIGEGTLISDNVAIIDNNHDHVRGKSSISTTLDAKSIIIGKNVTIYRNSTILSGIKIGEGSIVAAHSLVKEDVQPFTLVGGCPAKKLNDIE